MAYTRTGRPVGRPKTKDYQTISLKMPQELLDRVQAYARLHRQSLSELMRDGVEWRITEGDLRGVGVDAPQRTQSHEDEYYGNTEIPPEVRGEPEHAGILHEIRTALARQETQLHALTQALEHQTVVSTPGEYFGHTVNAPSGQPETPEPTQEGDAWHTPQDIHEKIRNTVLPECTPAFDSTKYVLGKLCPRGHAYEDTGQSLLQQSNHKCLVCHREQARASRQRKHQAPEDDLEDMALVPETASAALLRQREKSARPVAADSPSADALSLVEQRRARILVALPVGGDGLSPVAVRMATGLSKTQVANDLRDLSKRGEVVKLGEGHYVRTGPMPTTPQGKAEGARARRQAQQQALP